MTDPVTGSRSDTGHDPLLSVVVTIVDGPAALRRFLAALTRQIDPPPLEILVPFDASAAEVHALAGEFPTVTWLALGHLDTAAPITTAAGQHELYDRRRSAALAVARGDLVAILEDRGVPRPDWARTVVRLHREPWAVIGGAIEPAPCGLVEWALHVCDFSRYALPFASRSVDWVSDVNVTYKRHALERTRHLWQDRFHEPVVHWALQREGAALRLDPALVVDHYRTSRRFAVLVRERFDWGRLFGAIRAGAGGPLQRAGRVVATPLVPVVVLARHARVRIRRGETWRFVAALPVLLVLLAAWAAGEAWGLCTGRAAPR